MFCKKCGQPIDENSRFCTTCGTPVQQDVAAGGQPDHAGGAGNMPPYGGGAPPAGYPPYGGYQPPKKGMSKKAKGLMFGGIGLVLVLAIAAVLIFVVFAGGAWPLSGNTVQTRFVNEGAKVLVGAVSDFSTLKMADVSEQPFDMSASVKVKGSGLGMATGVDIDMAYDKLNLGAAADIGYAQMKLLLLEDTLYVDSGYGVTGVRFDTDADLSKAMGLKERLAALSASGNTADTKRLVEAFLNSINADCFNKTGDSFTLELSEADVQDALEVFAEKLDKDEGLRGEMEKLLEAMGQDADIDEMLEGAVSSLDYADFDLTIEIRYEGGAPTTLVIDAEGSGTSVEITFGYEKQGDTKVITLDIDGDSDYEDGTIELTVKKISGGLELNGSIESYSASYDFDGSIEKSGDTLSGSFDVSDLGTLEFDCTVKAGMPSKAVEDDRRFDIDTKDADVQDLEDAMGYSLPSISMATAAPAESAVLEMPAATEAPVMESAAPAEAMSSGSIGVLLPSDDGDYYGDTIDEYMDLAGQYGVEVTLMYANYDASTQIAQAGSMIASGVDALIVEPMYADTATTILAEATAAGVPVVFTGAGSEDYGSDNYVTIDYNEAGVMLGDMCYPGDICVISSMAGIVMATDMEEGLRDRLNDSAGYSVAAIQYASFDVAAGEELTQSMLEAYPDASTFVCLDPVAAEGVVQALADAGYNGKVMLFIDRYNLADIQALSAGMDVSFVYFEPRDTANSAFFLAQDILSGILSEHATIMPYWY